MKKIEKLVSLLEENKLDAIYLTDNQNVNYISNYTDEAAFAIISTKGNFLITDTRFMELAESCCKGFELVNWHLFDRSIPKAVEHICIKNNIKTLGFEGSNLTFDKYEEIKSILEKSDIRLSSTEGLIEELRYIKTEEEIKNIKKACEIADKALEELIPHIKVGAIENELAAKLEYFMKMNGAHDLGFETILVSGAKTSLLHGKPGDKKLEKGDFLLIDFGAMYNGYRSDMTRTFIIGEADERQLELYNLVKKAQLVGLENMNAGVHATVPDMKIREVVKKYEDNYYRGLGHGIGRKLHEEPFLGNYGTKTMKEGCVITMEPCIYFPGWGGVRIEDTVLITDGQPEILTKFPKELMILDK
ncbi:MAG: Xaa-Pro peptidase family protein [Terrisporobacter sp.]